MPKFFDNGINVHFSIIHATSAQALGILIPLVVGLVNDSEKAKWTAYTASATMQAIALFLFLSMARALQNKLANTEVRQPQQAVEPVSSINRHTR